MRKDKFNTDRKTDKIERTPRTDCACCEAIVLNFKKKKRKSKPKSKNKRENLLHHGCKPGCLGCKIE